MGDMADFYMAQAQNAGGCWSPPPRRRHHPLPTCRTCGMVALRWHEVRGKWKLFQGKKPHVCKTNNNTPEGFEDVRLDD